MAYSYSCTNAAVATGATEFTHGITVAGVSTAPTEWMVNARGVNAGGIFVSAAPGTTSMFVSTTAATGAVDLFCGFRHSIVS